jgi:hypothetical protein
MRISNPEIIELRDIFADALTLVELDDITLRLGRARQRITLGDNLDEIFREVVIYYNNRSQVENLLATARAVNPTNPDLYRFDQRFNRATQFPAEARDPAGLEKIIREGLGMVDARAWIEAAAAVENRVCLIRTATGALGTGFLVGPDVVMTNYHVVEPYIKDGRDPAGLQFRFDFMLTSDGAKPGPGTTWKVRKPGWLIDASPLHPSDKLHPDRLLDVPRDFLDYAVIRLDGRPGEEVAGGEIVPTGRGKPREWVRFPDEDYPFSQRKALIVLHHPQGKPMQLSIDTDSYAAANASGSRVFHRTNTEPGSSGSPCFDMDWNLVALHQGWNRIAGQAVNRAAPMTAIIELLDAREKLDEIGN